MAAGLHGRNHARVVGIAAVAEVEAEPLGHCGGRIDVLCADRFPPPRLVCPGGPGHGRHIPERRRQANDRGQGRVGLEFARRKVLRHEERPRAVAGFFARGIPVVGGLGDRFGRIVRGEAHRGCDHPLAGLHTRGIEQRHRHRSVFHRVTQVTKRRRRRRPEAGRVAAAAVQPLVDEPFDRPAAIDEPVSWNPAENQPRQVGERDAPGDMLEQRRPGAIADALQSFATLTAFGRCRFARSSARR